MTDDRTAPMGTVGILAMEGEAGEAPTATTMSLLQEQWWAPALLALLPELYSGDPAGYRNFIPKPDEYTENLHPGAEAGRLGSRLGCSGLARQQSRLFWLPAVPTMV